MHYCTRSAGEAAFLDELPVTIDVQRLHVYHDDGSSGPPLTLPTLLNAFDERTHLYCCEPESFMAAVATATRS